MMSDLDVVMLANGRFEENCYLVADRRRSEAVIIDPGETPDSFLAELEVRGWTLKAIWLTHAHIDHIMGVGTIHRATRVPIHLHGGDLFLYERATEIGASFGIPVERQPTPDVPLRHGDVLSVGDVTFEVLHTPGHSPGSVAFVHSGLMFGGDVLFRGSIGRTDLPGGDLDALMGSITRHFLTQPDPTVLWSGHGPKTTIGAERLANEFIRPREFSWKP